MRPTSWCRLAASAALLAAAALVALAGRHASAQIEEGWTIRSFDVSYDVQSHGTIDVVEDILVGFGTLERHGIFRDIPVEYVYDTSNNRLAELTDISVDDGTRPLKWRIDSERPNLRIRIGDPDVLVSGQQRYRIHYTINGGLNAFPDHDELFWNVTGNQWPVPIESASATVRVPSRGIERVLCFQGPTGSTEPCQSTFDPSGAVFTATIPLPPGAGLTIVVGVRKNLVEVGPPVLVPSSTDPLDEIRDFLGLKPLPIAAAVLLTAVGLAALARLWWVAGRDRWYGDMARVIEGPTPENIRPLGAHETIVVEYGPPEVEVDGVRRRLRPAELGVLMDEQADTLDVSASIVDLAVRGHLRIEELESSGIFGLFKQRDYRLERLENDKDALLPFESLLLSSLFGERKSVKLSDLRNEFYDELAQVKKQLYASAVKELRFFPRSPEAVRPIYKAAGALTAVAGVGLFVLAGSALGAALLGLPFMVVGTLAFGLAGAMPRRTAFGREMYRRCLGFRLYMETAERDRQRFAEDQNIFHEYLPYAIVCRCVDKWAKVFDDLGLQPTADYYVGTRGAYVPLQFAGAVSSFSAGVSTTMASTPGGSGSSGFGGGGSSGGGGGGGGGGSW